jgi:hypothetical protein
LSIIRRYVEAFRLRTLAIEALPNKAPADLETTMSNLHNLPAVLGVALAGSLIAYAAYRRSAKRMAQKRTADDLRSELRADQESLRAEIEALPAKIESAKRSRMAAAHAAGNTAPELQQWLCQLDLDLSELELLKSQLAADDSDHKSLSDMDVEIRLVEVLALSLRAGALEEKYRVSISLRETDRESRNDDSEALIREAAQYSLNNSRSSIIETAA